MTGAGAGAVRLGAHPAGRRLDLSRPSDRALAVALAIAAGLALLIWSPSVGGRAAGDPAAVAADARLARCGGTLDEIEFAFTMPRARDYPSYLPAMDRATELELDAPALVVVYRAEFPGNPATAPTPAGGAIRNLCVYVGQAGSGELNYLSDVSAAGLRATPTGPTLIAVPQT